MQNQVYGLLMKFFKQPNKQIIQFILKKHFFFIIKDFSQMFYMTP